MSYACEFRVTKCSLVIDLAGSNIYHAEFHCHGPGYEPEKRAHWARQLTEEEAAPFMSIDYIDGTKWLPVWL